MLPIISYVFWQMYMQQDHLPPPIIVAVLLGVGVVVRSDTDKCKECIVTNNYNNNKREHTVLVAFASLDISVFATF